MIVLGAVLPHPPILLPQIGQGREAQAQATLDAYAEVGRRIRDLGVRRLLLISTHGIVTLNRFHALRADVQGDFARFGDSTLTFARRTDTELVDAVLDSVDANGAPISAVDSWETSDHSIGVPIRLLEDSLPDRIAIVSISFRSATDHYACGQALGEALRQLDEPTAILASGDAVHSLSEESPVRFHPRAREVQDAIASSIAAWNREALIGLDESLRREVDESVVSPTLMLIGALGCDAQVKPRILAAEAPWGVGYVTALVEIGR